MCSFIKDFIKDNKYRGSCEPGNFWGVALFSGSNKCGQPFTIKCTHCRKNHKSYKCNVITNYGSQKANLRVKSQCFTCLCVNHSYY